MNTAFNGKRDYNEVLGYKTQLIYDDYLAWYRRGGIARQLVDFPRETCWRTPPVVQEDDNQYANTTFENAYSAIEEQFELNQIYKRADILAGIGRYAVILIGVKGDVPFEQPIEPGSLKSISDLAYITPYSEGNASILEYETDENNENFGKPTVYQLSVGAPSGATGGGSASGGVGIGQQTMRVHASRLIHVAEGILEDAIYGTPALEAVFNLLSDLTKVVGGSAEIFWLNARNGIKVELREGYRPGDPGSPENDKLINDIEAFSNQLKRYLLLQGADASTLLNNPSDPRGSYETITDQILGAIRIPKRLFFGSERGEQASTQDRITYAEAMMGRRTNHLTPNIVLKTVKHLMMLGALPQPTLGPIVKWKPLLELDEKERAQVAVNRSQAVQEYYTHPAAQQVVAPGEFRQWLGLEQDMTPEMQATIIPSAIAPPPEPPAITKEVINLPALTRNTEVEVVRDDLLRLEDRMSLALQNNGRPDYREQASAGELRAHVLSLTQQVQAMQLRTASETQVAILAQRVEQCMQQLTILTAHLAQQQTPPPVVAAPPSHIVNVNLPDSLEIPAPIVNVNVEAQPAPIVNVEAPPAPIVNVAPAQVTVQQARNTRDTVQRDEHGEILNILREVLDPPIIEQPLVPLLPAEAPVVHAAVPGEPGQGPIIHVAPPTVIIQQPKKTKDTIIRREDGEMDYIIREVIE